MHAAGMTTIHDGEKARRERKIAIERKKVIIDNSGLFCPREVPRYKTLINVIDGLLRAIGRHLRSMAAVEEYSLRTVIGSVQQPGEALADALCGGTVVQHHANVFRGETPFLERRTDQKR